jgi:hypothetical protein
MKKTHRLAASIGIVAVLVTPGISAFASEDTTTFVMNALQSVSRAEKNSYSDVLANRSSGTGVKRQDVAVRFDNGAVQVEVPWHALDGVSLQSSFGSISIGLPFASQAKRASLIDEGLAVFDNLNGTFTAPVIKADGSVAITSVIKGADAANRLEYRFGLPKGVRLLLDSSSGAVNAVDGQGRWVAGVAAPWARDSRGADVPTHFEVKGNSLIQVVDTRSNAFVYPIVADPWFGISLIDKATWARNLWAWSPTLMVYPTAFGRYFASNLAVSAAWAETLDKGVQNGFPNANTPSMKVQFDCHFIFVRVRNVNKSSWNLDSKLPVTDLLTAANYGCNYPVGDTVFG